MRKLLFNLMILGSIAATNIYGQGCSDAGFCTMDIFKPKQNDSLKTKANQFKLGGYYGTADNGILVYGNYMEYKRALAAKLGLDIKLTSIGQTSKELSTFGLSDIFINANYKVTEKLKLALGTKIPLTDGNKTKDGLSLPMDYQASLGTLDLILGLGYSIKKLQLVAAIQQPITQNNNQFQASNFPNDSELSDFQTTRNFKRSGDVLLRVSYPFQLIDKLKITPSLLPIYHLSNDTYTDDMNIEREIEGSQGLTLNANLYFDYQINQKNFIQLNFGLPLQVRDARPDGLTRHFIANLEYRIIF